MGYGGVLEARAELRGIIKTLVLSEKGKYPHTAIFQLSCTRLLSPLPTSTALLAKYSQVFFK